MSLPNERNRRPGWSADHSAGRPDPGRISTRDDFGRELTLARDRAGLSVRDVARRVGIQHSTAGGYFSGRHLPALKPPTLLTDILLVCGVTEAGELAELSEALVAGSADRTVRLWRVTRAGRTAPLGAPLVGFTGWVNAVAVSPDGHTLAVGGSDNTVRLFDVASHRALPVLPHPSPVTALAFVTDRLLATGASDGVARVWSLPGPTIADAADSVINLALVRGGRVLAAAAGSTVGLWEASDITRPARLAKPLSSTAPARAHSGTLAVSPDGRVLAAGSVDGSAQLWDISDPRRPVPLGALLSGPTGLCQSLAFSPDGRTLAAGSADRTVWLWTATGAGSIGTSSARAGRWRSSATLTSPTGVVYSVAFGSDSRVLAAGTADRMIRLWNIDPSQDAAAICAWSGDPITTTEWRQYIPNRPYAPPCRS